MTAAEAKTAGIVGNDRYSYFRADMGGSSMIKPTSAYEWFRFVSVDMENGIGEEGDSVGVVVPWEYKAATFELGPEETRKATEALEDGGPWRKDVRAAKWAGVAIAGALRLDLTAEGVKARVAGLLKGWDEEGTIEVYEALDEKREMRPYYRIKEEEEMDFG
jgi:hypothetical protein